MIEARALARRFGAVDAVVDVGFRAEDGAITGLLGPNGAGKSTTLRMLTTLLRPDAGSAQIDGHDIVAAPIEARRAFGALPHAGGLYPRLTARENLAYHGALHGMAAAQIGERIEQLATLLDLDALLDRRCKGFSQGQRTKVAIARAMIHDPNNLILDEPTNGLDVMAVRALRELLARLRDAGTCILLSSHVMQEVAALCDRIVVVAAGRVVADADADGLRALTGEDDLEEAFVALVAGGDDTASPAHAAEAEA